MCLSVSKTDVHAEWPKAADPHTVGIYVEHLRWTWSGNHLRMISREWFSLREHTWRTRQATSVAECYSNTITVTITVTLLHDYNYDVTVRLQTSVSKWVTSGKVSASLSAGDCLRENNSNMLNNLSTLNNLHTPWTGKEVRRIKRLLIRMKMILDFSDSGPCWLKNLQ